MEISEVLASRGNLRKISVHFIFFWIRTLFLIVTLLGIYVFFLNKDSEISYLNKIGLTKDISYLILCNFHIFFSQFRALISKNIYGMHCSIIFILNNLIVSFVLNLLSSYGLGGYKISGVKIFSRLLNMISFLYLLELFYSIYEFYKNQTQNNFHFFKQIGLNERVKSAFKTRKLLEASSSISLFLVTVLLLRDITLGNFFSKGSDFFAFFFFLLVCFKNLLISVNFNKEYRYQRKLAIVISGANIVMSVFIVALNFFKSDKKESATFFVTLIFNLDILLSSILLLYVLNLDYKKFGSGLKELFENRQIKIDLSSNYNN